MRVLIGHQHAYPVERICPTLQEGKRILREQPVNHVFIDYNIDRNGSGDDILRWAFTHKVFPHKVTLVTNKVDQRSQMGRTLVAQGYVTIDGINFIARMR